MGGASVTADQVRAFTTSTPTSEDEYEREYEEVLDNEHFERF